MRLFVTTLVVAVVGLATSHLTADAASKTKKRGSKSDYTAEQRDKIVKEGMAVCRKRYGAGVVLRVKVDWAKKRYICYTN